MPTHLMAHPPLDEIEERRVRKLAHRVQVPTDWSIHAKIVARSWVGLRTRQIAHELGRLGMKSGSGRKPRLTQQECSTILALVKLPPPGKPTYELTGELAAPDPDIEPEWTLDTLTAAARERGIPVAHNQVRRIFRQEGVRWRRTRLWATSKDPDFSRDPRPCLPTRRALSHC